MKPLQNFFKATKTKCRKTCLGLKNLSKPKCIERKHTGETELTI